MKWIQHAVLIAFFGLFLLWIGKGWIYRHMITYHIIGERKGYELTDPTIIAEIEKRKSQYPLSSKRILTIATQLTNQYLEFEFANTSADPNLIIPRGRTHCVGYAALFHAIVGYILQEENLYSQYRSHHLRAKLYLWGFNLHTWIDDPFFLDHDINSLEDLRTGEVLYVDPTVSDYLGIHSVKADAFQFQ